MKCATIDELFFEMQLQSISLHECNGKCEFCRCKIDCDMTLLSIEMIARGEY